MSTVGLATRMPLFRHVWRRRALLLFLVAVCAVLSLFPQQYRAIVSLTPSDPATLGLSGTLNQLGAVGNVFGNQAAIEVSLKVARSAYVRRIVAEKSDLQKRLGLSQVGTLRWLDRNVDIRAMRGGIIQFELKLRDADLAKDVIAAYGEAVRVQLGIVARNQTGYKRQILTELVKQADERLTKAQAAYDNFRLQSRYIVPEAAIMNTGDLIPQLEATIRSKEVELNAARQFGTDDNIAVRQIIAQIDSLKRQLSEARSLSMQQGSSVGQLVLQSTEVDRLVRELDLSRGLYDNYKIFLQGTSVEDLTSMANVRILEPAYIEPDRQYNYIPMGIGIVILLFGLAMEFYTLRPPLQRSETR